MKEGTGGNSLFELSLEDLMNIVDSVPSLTQALQDEDSGVRQSVAWALGQIGKDAVPALIKALQDKHEYVRVNAEWALRQIRQKH